MLVLNPVMTPEAGVIQVRVEQAQGARPVDREALRENIRRTVDQAIQEARAGSQAAQDGARAAQEARGAQGSGGLVISSQDFPAPPVPGQAGTTRVVVDGRNAIPPEVTDIMLMFFIMIAAIAILRPIMNAFGKRLERRAMPAVGLPPETAQQIARIEQTVEAMAIEIERISEGQRFAAKLLSEREREKLPG
ncbi:MAG TPA: hypothetical protein VGD77_01065 [Gemmatimonadaceae bacterium]